MLHGVDLSGKAFLDIGSDKGGVIISAYMLGCRASAGVEYENDLHIIAMADIQKLGLSSHCASYNCDAVAGGDRCPREGGGGGGCPGAGGVGSRGGVRWASGGRLCMGLTLPLYFDASPTNTYHAM